MTAGVNNLNLNVVERMREIAPTMGLKEDDQKQIINCIQNYANPDYKDAICWLAYRIWNAIKAIFGQSDWQLSRDLVQGKASVCFTTIVSDVIRESAGEESPDEAVLGKSLMRDEIDDAAKRGASLLLEFLLKGHNLQERGASNEEKAALKEEGESRFEELGEEFQKSLHESMAQKKARESLLA